MKRMVDNKKIEEIESKIGIAEYIIQSGTKKYLCYVEIYFYNDATEISLDLYGKFYIPLKDHINEDISFDDRTEVRNWIYDNIIETFNENYIIGTNGKIIANNMTIDKGSSFNKGQVFGKVIDTDGTNQSITINWDDEDLSIAFKIDDLTTGKSVAYEE